MKQNELMMIAVCLLISLAGCSDGVVTYLRPDSNDVRVTFKIPAQQNRPTRATRVAGKDNEHDLYSLTIYMFGDKGDGNGYVLQNAFRAGEDGQSDFMLSQGGEMSDGERLFTLNIEDWFQYGENTIKRFYFVANLGDNATKTTLCDSTLSGTIKAEDFEKIMFSSTNPGACLLYPGNDSRWGNGGLPMFSNNSGDAWVEADIRNPSGPVEVHLQRAYARFDIVNYAAHISGDNVSDDIISGFTITSIKLVKANTTGYVFPNAHTTSPNVEHADCLLTNANIPDLNRTPFTLDSYGYPTTIVNGKDVSIPSFYILPTHLNDTATFIQIQGRFGDVDVIQRVRLSDNDEIRNNNIYRVYFTRVKSEINVSLVVEDWDSITDLPFGRDRNPEFDALYTSVIAGDGSESKGNYCSGNSLFDGIYSVATIPQTNPLRLLVQLFGPSDDPNLNIKLSNGRYPISLGDRVSSQLVTDGNYLLAYQQVWPIIIRLSEIEDLWINTVVYLRSQNDTIAKIKIACPVNDFPVGSFAASNIYWDGTKLTFDTTPNAEPTLQKQGVFFKWGSLIGISPNHSSSKIYVPDVATQTWVDDKTFSRNPWGGSSYSRIPYVSTVFESDPQDYDYRSHSRLADITDYSNYQGDICKYLSETGAVSGNWRMPTVYDCSRGVQYAEMNDYSFADANFFAKSALGRDLWATFGQGPWSGIAEATDDGTYLFDRGLVVDKIDYFPASGQRIDTGGYTDSRSSIWTGSAPEGLNSAQLLTANTGGIRFNNNSRGTGLPVRCVKVSN